MIDFMLIFRRTDRACCSIVEGLGDIIIVMNASLGFQVVYGLVTSAAYADHIIKS